jgi:hypothetical protein
MMQSEAGPEVNDEYGDDSGGGWGGSQSTDTPVED